MAKWRRRIVRGLALAMVGGLASIGWLVYQATGSAAVRQQVIAQLRQRFIGAEVALGSARLRLLGGITFNNLTLYRRDDPSQTPFLHVPAGTIYHDKEQLGQGRLVIRKIKFERPRLTASRAPDGRWNLDGILGLVRPDVPIPVFEIQKGTVVVDYAENGAATESDRSPRHHVEVYDVDGSLLNHPLSTLNFDLRGQALLWGPIAVRGALHRIDGHMTASLTLAPVTLTAEVAREAARFAPGLAEPIEQISGAGRLHLDLTYRPEATRRWQHQFRAELRNVSLTHRLIPFPLECMNIDARGADGEITIESLTANSGSTRLSAKARIAPAATAHVRSGAEPPESLEPFQSLEVNVGNLQVVPELFDKLPAYLAAYRQKFAPSGACDLKARFDRSADRWSAQVVLSAQDMAGRFESFPYPLSGVRGKLDLTASNDAPPRLDVDIAAHGSTNRPVTIRGHVVGPGPNPEYAYDMYGDGLPIDENLLQALPAKFENIARSFHPRGYGDISATIRRAAGTEKPRQDYRVHVRDLAVCYDVFPVPLERASGRLDIHLTPPGDPEASRFTFTDFRAADAEGRVTLSGTAQPTPNGDSIALTIRGEGVPLDPALANAFSRMKLRPLWDMMAPTGHMDFDSEFRITENPGGTPEFDLRVATRGATVRPSFLPLVLTDLNGTFHATRTRVDVANVMARHGSTHLQLAGGTIALNQGGYFADLAAISAEPLPVDETLLQALPVAVQSIFRSLDVRGTLAAHVARLVILDPPHLPGAAAPPLFYWDAKVSFSDAALRTGVDWENVTGVVASKGRYRGHTFEGVEGHVALERASIFRQPLSNLHARIAIDPKTPHIVQLDQVQAKLYGGQIGGEANVAFGAGLQYRIDLKGLGLQLEELARHNRFPGNAQMSGLARAELYLTGAGAGTEELEGRATIHVPSGRLYNLPIMLDLLKVIGLHAPDGTAFEEAHADLGIHGQRVQVQRLDLLGNAISIGGNGELNLDGSDLKLDCYVVWGYVVQLLPAALREIPPWLSKNLFRIAARGQLGGAIDFKAEPVPGLVDPVRQLVDRMQKRLLNPTAGGARTMTPRLKGN